MTDSMAISKILLQWQSIMRFSAQETVQHIAVELTYQNPAKTV